MTRTSVARRIVCATAALAMAIAVFAGCQQKVGYEVRYELHMTEAVVEANAPETGPTTRELACSVTWTVTSEGLDAHITNPADTTVSILWEGAMFSYDGGEPEPLVSTSLHETSDIPQPPTVIPAGGTMIVGMLPSSNAEWEWLPSRAMGGSWGVASALFDVQPTSTQTEEERTALAETAVGEKFKIQIPISIGSREITYIFDARVMRAEVHASFN